MYPEPSSLAILALCLGAATIGWLSFRDALNHDPREPPLAPQSIPIIGHILGMSMRKFEYYVDLR
jgi:hypothetical protein